MRGSPSPDHQKSAAPAWRAAYAAAKRRGMEALNDVRPGDRMFVSSACAEPQLVVAELVERSEAGRLSGTVAYQMFHGSTHRLLQLAGQHGNRVVGITGSARLANHVSGGATYMPWTIFQTASLLRTGQLRFDVAIVQASPPDRRGYLSLGISVDFALDACRQARLVFAEVNDQVPHTSGDGRLHCSQVHALIEASYPLLEMPPGVPDDSARQVAANVLSFIPDGATIEIGVGKIMSAVLDAMSVRNDLGLHTGLFIEEMVPLIEKGTINNAKKGFDRGVSVANQVRGRRRTYAFLDGNAAVELRSASYTHAPQVLAELPAFRAINSALEVDLYGRVNSEILRGRRVASTGGLGDFVRAARYGRESRSIIALSATADGGSISRIVASLAAPEAVTLTPDLADVVVTEFGAAELSDKTPAERAEALIAIAAPQHRAELIGAAAKGSRTGGEWPRATGLPAGGVATGHQHGPAG